MEKGRMVCPNCEVGNEAKKTIPLRRRIIYAGDVFNSLMAEKGWSATEAADFVKAFRTVDAVEVVHGEWTIIEDDYFDLVEMRCSVCGESYGFDDYEDDTPQKYHYCPNCGADMRDGDGNG